MFKSFRVYGLIQLVAFATIFVTSLGIYVSVQANTSSPWTSANLSLQKDGDLPVGLSVPFSINGNRDCSEHKFVTRPARALQTEVSHTACGVQSLYGLIDPGGWLELSGTATSGKLTNYSGYLAGNIPIPSSLTLINYTSAPSGLYLHFTKNLPGALTPTITSSGEVTYKISRPADISLRDRANNLLQTHPDSLSFSSNGQWMVIDARYRAMLRVNLETFEVLPFAPTFNYDIGLTPGLQTAITSDGRYAVVYSKTFTVFKIYDLNTCGSVPNVINAPVTCQFRDLLPAVQQQITGFQGISRIRFISDDTISFYANYYSTPGVSSTNKIAKFRLGAGEISSAKIELLALGESYISGEGAFQYQSGTDIPENRCHLSLVSYPYLIAEILDFNTFHSIACSGAKTSHITDVSIPRSNLVKTQATGKDDPVFDYEIFNEFLPGYRAQINFVTKLQPEKILVSIGGNDIGFSNILRRCLEPDTCYSTYEDRVELVREINSQFPNLVDTYQKIKQEGPPNSKVYAVGYPQIVYPDGNCAVNVRLNAQELEFARLLTAYLDSLIKAAADKVGVGYVDTQKALDGHKLCETKGKDIAVNGLTAGDNTPSFLRGPIGNESYHPNKLGHQLLAASVLSGTENLTKVMPTANNTAAPPAETGLEMLNAPKNGRAINQVNYDDGLANDIVYRETWWDAFVDGTVYSLKAFTPFGIFLNSEPVSLGMYGSDSGGNLQAQLRIPADVPTGFHTLHVYGTNMAGEPVDIYKTIYVASDETDYDGDGMQNSADSCSTLENSGQDFDQDGIDDACDGIIGDQPATVAQSAGQGPNQSSSTDQSQQSSPITTVSQSPAAQNAAESIQPTVSAEGLQAQAETVVLSETIKPTVNPVGVDSVKAGLDFNDLSISIKIAALLLTLGSGMFIFNRFISETGLNR